MADAIDRLLMSEGGDGGSRSRRRLHGWLTTLPVSSGHTITIEQWHRVNDDKG